MKFLQVFSFVVLFASTSIAQDFKLEFPNFTGIEFAKHLKVSDSTLLDTELNRYGQKVGNSLLFLDAIQTNTGEVVTTYTQGGFRGTYLFGLNSNDGELLWENSFTRDNGYNRFLAKKIIELPNQKRSFLGDYLTSTFPISVGGAAGKFVTDEDGNVENAYMKSWQEGGAYIYNEGIGTAYEFHGNNILVFDRILTKPNAGWVRLLDSECFLTDTIAFIPSPLLQAGARTIAALQKGIWKVGSDELLCLHFEWNPDEPSDTTQMKNVLTSFDFSGNIIWQKSIQGNLAHSFYLKARRVQDRLLLWDNIELSPDPNSSNIGGVIAQYDLEGNLLHENKLQDDDGNFLKITVLEKSHDEESLLAVFIDVRNNFFIQEIKLDGTVRELAHFFATDQGVRIQLEAILPLKDLDALLYFNVSPDTIIDGDRIWEYVEENYIAFLKKDQLDYAPVAVADYNSAKKIKIYPNPANDFFTLELQTPISEGTMFLFNNLGGKVAEFSIDENSKQQSFSNLHTFPGTYFFKIVNNFGVIETGKIFFSNP